MPTNHQGACWSHPVSGTTWQATLVRMSLYGLSLATMESLCPLVFLVIFVVFLFILLPSVLDISNDCRFPPSTPWASEYCGVGDTVTSWLSSAFTSHSPLLLHLPQYWHYLTSENFETIVTNTISQPLLFRYKQNSCSCVLILSFSWGAFVFSLPLGHFTSYACGFTVMSSLHSVVRLDSLYHK